MRLARAKQPLAAFIIARAPTCLATHGAITIVFRLRREDTFLLTDQTIRRAGIANSTAQFPAQRDALVSLDAVERLQVHVIAALLGLAVAAASTFVDGICGRVERAEPQFVIDGEASLAAIWPIGRRHRGERVVGVQKAQHVAEFVDEDASKLHR